MPPLRQGRDATQHSPVAAAGTPTPPGTGGSEAPATVSPSTNEDATHQRDDRERIAIVELHDQAVHNREVWRINDLLNVARPRTQQILWKLNKFAYTLQEQKCQLYLQQVLALPPEEMQKHWPKLKKDCSKALRVKRNSATSMMKFRFYGTCTLPSPVANV